MNPSLSMRDGSRDGGPAGTLAAGGTGGAGGGSAGGGAGVLGFSATAGAATAGALGFSEAAGGTGAGGFAGVTGGGGGALGFSGAGGGEIDAVLGACLAFSTGFGAGEAMSARSWFLTATFLGSESGRVGGGSGFLSASRADSRTSSEDFAPSRTTMFSSSLRESERWSRKIPAPTKAHTRPPIRTSTPAVIAHSIRRFPRLGFSSLRGTQGLPWKGELRSFPNSSRGTESYEVPSP